MGLTMPYDLKTISKHLTSTALGNAYYGNALYVARDISCLNDFDRFCLSRWLNGTNTAADSLQLQTIANKLTEKEWSK